MRRRITKAFFATAAAGATITTLGLAASPAGAAAHGAFTPTGTIVGTDANCVQSAPPLPGDNCGRDGYQATGRTFRFAQALIDIPNHTGVKTTDAEYYVALDNSGTNTWQYARVGLAPCPSGTTAILAPGATATTCPLVGAGNTSGWVAFTATADVGSLPVVTTHPISAASMGDGVLVNVYEVPTGQSVQTTITLPNGTTYNNSFSISGLTYTKAQAVQDFTETVENGGAQPAPAVPSAKVRDTQFFQGRFTTTSGAKGTFNGPWTVDALEATSNGSLPPTGTLIGQPSFLWNDGSGFNGMGDDAFGVWRFPF
jgi:hypothetical protein